MKKPLQDRMELQLQEYDWQVDVVSDRRIAWMTACMTEMESADIEEDKPEYRH